VNGQQPLNHCALQDRQIAGARRRAPEIGETLFGFVPATRVRPSASITALTAPAEVPEMPSIASRSHSEAVQHAPGERAGAPATL